MYKSKLRRAAGKLKFRVLDCWPYKFKQAKAKRLRDQFSPIVFQLPQIPAPAPPHPELEIHILCSKAHLDMGIWASWSILRFLNDATLYVHSDGTLQIEELDLWTRVVQGLIFVSKEEADARVAAKISKSWPLLYQWRCNYWSSAQLVDMHLFGNSDKFLVMDSDVLCFRDPFEVRRSLVCSKPIFRWNRGIHSAYLMSIDLINQIIGVRLVEALNSGFLITPRFTDELFELLERTIGILKTDHRVNTRQLWSGQTYYAICAANWPDSEPLPDGYSVTRGQMQDDAVVRHYVGVPSIRPRYFTEGVPKLLRDLSNYA
jgi:hypothetical protein